MEDKEKNTQTHQTNNVLYGRKHRYMFALKELTALKNEIDHEVLNEGLPKVRAQEIHDIYTRIIVGLIEEGVTYQYIRDSGNAKNDIIRLYIDGSIYECKNIDIREVLEDRYKDVMSAAYEGPTLGEIQKSRKRNEDPALNNMGIKKEEVTNLLIGIKDAIDKSKGTTQVIIDSSAITKTIEDKLEDRQETENEPKGVKKVFAGLIDVLITIFLVVAVILVICCVPGLKDSIRNSWVAFTQSFNGAQEEVIHIDENGNITEQTGSSETAAQPNSN